MSQAQGVLGFFQVPEKVHSFAKCSNAESLGLALAALILSVMGVGFFPLTVLPKLLTWELVSWRTQEQKESNARVLMR